MLSLMRFLEILEKIINMELRLIILFRMLLHQVIWWCIWGISFYCGKKAM